MSLFRQLWLAILGLILAIFIGSFLISTYSARNYLQEQLSLKNHDNAESLALALSQQPNRDQVAINLTISALFDTGHYQLIRLLGPDQKVLIEHQYQGKAQEAPSWFMRLFPLHAKPGVAHVQDGWRQLGTLTVISHHRFAYRELWRGALKMLAWFIAAGLLAGIVGSMVIRAIARPLNQVVDQAHAIQERRFITLPEPRTLELKSVVHAMNALVQRLQQFFAEEAVRLDSLRRALNHDQLTGLVNRALFMHMFQDALEREQSPTSGALLLLRITNLQALNQQLGHNATDQLLQHTSAVLEGFGTQQNEAITARLNGADFALLVPGRTDLPVLCEAVTQTLFEPLQKNWPSLTEYFHLGAVAYQRGDDPGAMLASADQMLATAEAKGANTWHALPADNAPQVRASEVWHNALRDSLAAQSIQLALYPVTTLEGKVIHQEGFIRLQDTRDSKWLVAGDFMPMAIRHKLTASLDLAILTKAFELLPTTSGAIAINICGDTLPDWNFRNQLSLLLKQHDALCSRLAIEVTEYGAFRHMQAFRDVLQLLKAHGCHVGIDHAGQRLQQWPQLSDLGLDYLKVDHGFIQPTERAVDPEFLSGVCKMAHAMGIRVIAEGVKEINTINELYDFKFDGVTGPAINQAYIRAK